MHMDGVTYRKITGRDQPVAPLLLASRRGEASAVVRRFLRLANETAIAFRSGLVA
jgi:hypothetical protein